MKMESITPPVIAEPKEKYHVSQYPFGCGDRDKQWYKLTRV